MVNVSPIINRLPEQDNPIILQIEKRFEVKLIAFSIEHNLYEKVDVTFFTNKPLEWSLDMNIARRVSNFVKNYFNMDWQVEVESANGSCNSYSGTITMNYVIESPLIHVDISAKFNTHDMGNL